MRSACRGEARNTSMPSRLMSKSAAPTDIISIAQQARPKVAGQTLLRRAHLTRSSIRPVRKLCWRSSNPIDQAASPGDFDALIRVMVDSDVRLGRPDCRAFDGPQVRAPLEIK